ncbi:hypothetical protein JQ582_33010 [Bradyrhizobium japonicum]|uniref:hypothetical protein n=1 Tax=Bradyrhizobium japonicum TaxID=375 RepID=UPI001BA68DA2|nr:hypothetical protein [Bradyrhizobium japonicum]MBR0748762.1 hypothetical protein [Bradyrhizobium japonicum]
MIGKFGRGFFALLTCWIASCDQALSDDCSEILKFGIWESYSNPVIDQADQSFANNMCARMSRDPGGGINILGYGLVNFGEVLSDEKCAGTPGALKINKGWFETAQRAASEVVGRWNKCRSEEGTHASIIQASDLSRYKIVLNRVHSTDVGERVVLDIKPFPSCIQRDATVEFAGEKIINGCERTPDRETSIDVKFGVNINFRKDIAQHLLIPPLILSSTPTATTDPRIVGVSVPANSSDAQSWPVNQKVWTATFPIRDANQIGIGYMVEPEPFYKNWTPSDFVMHDHVYTAPGTPDANRAFVTFSFNKPARIAEVLIVQHANGVAEIEGFVGDNQANLRSIGRAHTSFGANLPLQPSMFRDGYRDLFKFPTTGEGKMFRVVITRTTLGNGYAFFRLYPRNLQHNPFEVVRIEELVDATK